MVLMLFVDHTRNSKGVDDNLLYFSVYIAP